MTLFITGCVEVVLRFFKLTLEVTIFKQKKDLIPRLAGAD